DDNDLRSVSSVASLSTAGKASTATPSVEIRIRDRLSMPTASPSSCAVAESSTNGAKARATACGSKLPDSATVAKSDPSTQSATTKQPERYPKISTPVGMVSRFISASLRVLRDTNAERRAASAGGTGASGACEVVSTKVSATVRPVSCSRACQKRAPGTEPQSRSKRKRPSDTGAPGTKRGPRTIPADIGGGTGEELNASKP